MGRHKVSIENRNIRMISFTYTKKNQKGNFSGVLLIRCAGTGIESSSIQLLYLYLLSVNILLEIAGFCGGAI